MNFDATFRSFILDIFPLQNSKGQLPETKNFLVIFLASSQSSRFYFTPPTALLVYTLTKLTTPWLNLTNHI